MMLKYLYTISINGGKTHSKEVRQRLSNSVEITGLIQISQHEAKYRVLLQKCVQQRGVSLDSFGPPFR